MTQTVSSTDQKCGFVSVLGVPNAGKSTLINTLVGGKVSIVSRKVQTTRTRVLGMAIHNNAQIILIDTPGVFKPKKTLEKAMVTSALGSFEDADFVIHIFDAAQRDPIQNNKMIFDALNKHEKGKKKVILVLNKIDRVPKEKLLELADELNKEFDYTATFMISALNKKGTQNLADYLSVELPDCEWIYPEDQMSDMPMRLMAAEITREKVYNLLHQEIPYSIFVATEEWDNFDNGDVRISQVITVEKDSQKSIVLGKGGAKIKAIGMSSRLELEEILGCKVHLKTFVRVQENWAERTENYEMFGLAIPK